ncbi:MAG: ABC transporter permease subunit [Staphylothermus sp.]|nr:ABC transporter permease subunit [Staphylothermus sp.]
MEPRTKIARLLLSLSTLVLIWYLLSLTVPHYLFPDLIMVLQAFKELLFQRNLLWNLLMTLTRVTIGFLLGVLTGFFLGSLFLYSRIVRDIVYPIIAFIVVIPSFAFIPLLMIWVGLNDWLVIIGIMICTAFPLVYALISSHKYIDKRLLEFTILHGIRGRKLYFKIILPLSVTHIATILRYEAGHSWRLGFVTEYLALSNGLGALMLYAYSTLRVDQVIALIITIGALTLLFQKTIDKVETKILRKWHLI